MKFLEDYIRFILFYYQDLWWFILPLLLGFILWDLWLLYRRIQYLESIERILLEIKIPQQVTKTPRAMEEVFNALHACYVPGGWYKRYIQGYVPAYYIFELVAHNRQLRFFVNLPRQLKEFFSSRLYAHYPEAEVEEVKDYLEELPPDSPNQLFDIWGTELKLTKESGYPIKTYLELENLQEEERIDPITVFTELAAKLEENEWVVLHIFAMPVSGKDPIFGEKWLESAQNLRDKLMGREKEKEKTILQELGEFTKNLLLAPFRYPQWGSPAEEKKELPTMERLSPGERTVIENIERKMSKMGYWCGFRMIYIAKKESYKKNLGHILPMMFSVFRVLDTQNMNSFGDDDSVRTAPPSPTSFEKLKEFVRKRKFYSNFYSRTIPRLENLSILVGEELATIYHPPMEFVFPSGIEKIETRKGPPPPEIPSVPF